MVVDADEGAGKGEYLAEGDQHAAVYHPRRRNTYPCREQCAPEKDKSERQQQLTSGTSPVPSFKGGEFRVSAFSPCRGVPTSNAQWGALEGGVRGGLLRCFFVLLCEGVAVEGFVALRVLLVGCGIGCLLLRR